MLEQLNRRLWENYEDYATARGESAAAVLSRLIDLQGARILDFGAGTGGVSHVLAQRGAFVTAVEINEKKAAELRRLTAGLPVTLVADIPQGECYDAVVLLDVIEHLVDWRDRLAAFYRCLKPGGVVYLSTPNKLSPFNLLCDPHFSLPLVSLLPRQGVRAAASLFGYRSRGRRDFPQLLTLSELLKGVRRAGFRARLVNRAVVAFAMQRPESLWNRPLHLQLVKRLPTGARRLLLRLLSDRFDAFNALINPTWYMLLVKPMGLRGSV